MDILKNLYRGFRIVGNDPPASQDDIDTLRRSTQITVPEDYVNVVKEMAEVDIVLEAPQRTNRYVRIWRPLYCLAENEGYQADIPRSLIIGDTGGGDALMYMTGKKGFGLYQVNFGVMDIDEAKFIAPSLEDFLTKGIGTDVFTF